MVWGHLQRLGYAMLGEEIMRTKAGDKQCSKPLVLMGRGFLREVGRLSILRKVGGCSRRGLALHWSW